MALIGDGFVDYVKDQIDTRQKALGEYDNRNIKNTKAFMTRTPWVRMVSSVDLTEGNKILPGKSVLSTIKSSGNYSGIDLSGDKLAKNFILFNGISNQQGGIDNLYSGITGSPSSKLFGGAYGFGSRDDIQNERGFVPMPGITNVNFTYKNDGALATATVQIKAFNRSQFQLIDVLFQRPGYTVLLEFGNTVYLDNKGNLKEADYNTEPFNAMFKENQDMFTLHGVIAAEKIKWDGNYDGFFAKIAKWNWKFNADGSYDITVSLVGMGDVIESLKINVTPKSKLQDIKISETELFSEKNNIVVSEAMSSEFNFRLYEIYLKSKGLVGGEEFVIPLVSPLAQGSIAATVLSAIGISPLISIKREEVDPDFPFAYFPIQIKEYPFVQFSDSNTSISYGISRGGDLVIEKGGIAINPNQGNVSFFNNNLYAPPTYITFGTLLALITKYLSIMVSSTGNEEIPLINFNFDFSNLSKDTNYMATFPGNFSSNPNICLIPYYPILQDITTKINLPDFQNKIKDDVNFPSLNEKLKNSFFNVDGNPLIGRIANVYLNLNFITKTFKETVNDKKEVILLDFLKNILNGMNNALGGINEFRIIHNKDTNLFEILSENPLNTNPNTKPHTINTFGVTKGEGSFVREMDLNSELTDEYSTSITIGAQANGNTAQANSTSFSIYNKGLEDRIIKEKVNINSNIATTESKEIPEDPFLNLFSPDVIKCFSSIYIDREFTDENTSILENINSQFCKLATGRLTQQEKYPAPFFLPFNLSLTMDGLSGMKIYQNFKVDGKALPLTYNSDDIQLIIKNLSHDISPDGWLTKVETLAAPIIPFVPPTNLTQGKYLDINAIQMNDVMTEQITPAETENNIVIAKQYFEQRGFSPVQVSAIIGALLQESRLNPNIKNNIGAYGIAQWLDYDRRKNLLVKPNFSNLRTQLDYIIEEFNSTERISGNRLKKATTLEEAIAAMAGYERYGGIKGQSPTFEDVLRAPETGNRIGFAKNIFNRYDKIGIPPKSPDISNKSSTSLKNPLIKPLIF